MFCRISDLCRRHGKDKEMLNVLFVLVLVTVLAPFAYYRLSGGKRAKECMILNIVTFFGLILAGSVYCLGSAVPALATGEQAAGLSVGEG